MLNAFVTFQSYFRCICKFLFYFHSILHKRIYFSFFYAHGREKEICSESYLRPARK